MKVCTTCRIEKDNLEFNKNKAKKDGLNTICRDCSNKRSKLYYSDNREHHKAVIQKRNKKIRGSVRGKILEILNSNPCKDCGISDIRVLEFDHLPQYEKFKDISTLMRHGYSWQKIKEEIDKCDIVCANCHKIRTYNRRPCYKNK